MSQLCHMWDTIRFGNLPGCVPVSPNLLDRMRYPDTIFIQGKEDGHHRMAGIALIKENRYPFVCGHRESSVSLMRENVFEKLPPHIKKQIETLPTDTVVDCELFLPGGTATDVPRAIKQQDENLKLKAFGILYHQGSPYYSNMLAVQFLLHKMKFPSIPLWNTGVSASAIRADWDTIIEINRDLAKREGLEGCVFKSCSWDQAGKDKPMRTWDVVVTGSEMANPGKFQGLIGTLLCSVYEDGNLVEIAKCSGMNDAARRAFTACVPVGKVIEISAQGIGAKGRLRHPQFKSLRPDKQPKACLPLKEQM